MVGWLVGWLAGWLVGLLVGWVGWLGWLVGWFGWLVRWLVGWLVSWLVGWLVGASEGRRFGMGATYLKPPLRPLKHNHDRSQFQSHPKPTRDQAQPPPNFALNRPGTPQSQA